MNQCGQLLPLHPLVQGFLSSTLPIFFSNDTLLLSLDGNFCNTVQGKGKSPTLKYQKYLLKNALMDLFLMQITQTEIILSFRPNYIPYISGASWFFFQLLQFLEGYSSSVPIRLLLPRSLQLYSEKIIYYQSSHLYDHM